MGISGVLDGVDIESKCARSGSSALQKSQTLRWSATTVSASVERVLERNETSVAEAGHAAVFRNCVVVFEAIIPSSLRVSTYQNTQFTLSSRAFFIFFLTILQTHASVKRCCSLFKLMLP